MADENVIGGKPIQRLKDHYRKKEIENKARIEKRKTLFEDTKEVKTINEEWQNRLKILKDAGANLSHINRERMIVEAEKKQLEPLFDEGLLTPVNQKEKILTPLEEAAQNLKKQKEALDEASKKLEELKG